MEVVSGITDAQIAAAIAAEATARDAAIAAAVGLGQELVLTSFDTVVGLTLAALTANRAHLAYLGRLDRPLPIVSLGYYVGSASGNVDLALLSRSGTTATRLASTGSTAAAGASAIQTINVSAQALVPAGVDLYAAIAPDNATLTVGRIAGSSPILAVGTRVAYAETQFPIEASFSITTPTTVMPLLVATFAEPV
jgi:hypothetical protein